ncbi:hypothetical protein [Streptomyces sp. NPDC048462]|uniref:hypothetical protein n=1 Tax=Streptomyces sp. NPDC048462 TaxID=3365555 RepID=UPI00371EADBF
MDPARALILSEPLTATEHHPVQHAAAAAGQNLDESVRAVILDTVAGRVQYDYACM